MPGERTIRWAASVRGRKPSNRADLQSGRTYQVPMHLEVPSQVPPRVEQERVYPRPLTGKETGEYKAMDPSQRRVQAHTDRAPTLTGSETIDTTGKANSSAVPSGNSRVNVGSGNKSCGAKGLCRSKDNNRKRPNPRYSADKRDTALGEGVSGPAGVSRDPEIARQVRIAYARGGNQSKFTEVFSP